MRKIKDAQQHLDVEIAVKNFGPIAEANIDLCPLTVFVGSSNTGKTYLSTLMYALRSGVDINEFFKIGFLSSVCGLLFRVDPG